MAQSSISDLRREARSIADRAESERRDFTEAEESRLDEILTAVNVEESAQRRARGDELERLFAGGDGDGSAPRRRAATSLGQLVTESDQYRAFLRAFPNGLPRGAQVGQIFAGLEIGGYHEVLALLHGRKAVDVPDFVHFPDMVPPDRDTSLPEFHRPPLTIRSLITVGRTSSNLVEYPQITGVEDNAAIVAAPGELKPESELDIEVKSVPVQTIAHLITVARQSLSDIGQLRTWLDRFLLTGLDEALERYVFSGSGAITGILNTAGIQSQPFDTDIVQTARRAMTRIMITPPYAMPTAFVLSPQDQESIDLLRGDDGHFMGSGPWAMGPNTLWGLPRATSLFMPEGTGIVGDFREAVLWDREQGTISASDSHKDYFQRNLVAILAELRAAFGVLEPSAFCKFETNPNGPGGEVGPSGDDLCGNCNHPRDQHNPTCEVSGCDAGPAGAACGGFIEPTTGTSAAVAHASATQSTRRRGRPPKRSTSL